MTRDEFELLVTELEAGFEENSPKILAEYDRLTVDIERCRDTIQECRAEIASLRTINAQLLEACIHAYNYNHNQNPECVSVTDHLEAAIRATEEEQ